MQLHVVWLLCVTMNQAFLPQVSHVCLIEHSEAECLQAMNQWLQAADQWRVRSGLPLGNFLAVCHPL